MAFLLEDIEPEVALEAVLSFLEDYVDSDGDDMCSDTQQQLLHSYGHEGLQDANVSVHNQQPISQFFACDGYFADHAVADIVENMDDMAEDHAASQLVQIDHSFSINEGKHEEYEADTAEGDTIVQSTTTNTSTTQLQLISTRPVKKNPNKARNERKQELIYLRNKVFKMEQQLMELKQATSPSCSGTGGLLSRCERLPLKASSSTRLRIRPRNEFTTSSRVWETVARGQYEQRVDAERENIRLKLILEEQIKVAKSLEKILYKRAISKGLDAYRTDQRSKWMDSANSSALSDAAIFRDLSIGVEQCYLNVDTVFLTNRQDMRKSGGGENRNAAHMRDGVNGMYLEIFADKVLPFEKHATGTAVWQHFVHNMDRLPRKFYQRKDPKHLDVTDDTITESFSLEMRANDTKADFLVKQIRRRFVEEDRIIIVWRALIDPIEFSDEPVSGYRYHEDGYIIVKQPSTMSSEFTLVQTCFVITPDFSDDVTKQTSKIGKLTDFMLSTIAAYISASHRMVENVLLDQTLRNHRASNS